MLPQSSAVVTNTGCQMASAEFSKTEKDGISRVQPSLVLIALLPVNVSSPYQQSLLALLRDCSTTILVCTNRRIGEVGLDGFVVALCWWRSTNKLYAVKAIQDSWEVSTPLDTHLCSPCACYFASFQPQQSCEVNLHLTPEPCWMELETWMINIAATRLSVLRFVW